MKLRVPVPIEPGNGTPKPYPPKIRESNVFVAEADLDPSQIQDLADQVAAIKKAAVGLNLGFRLQITLGGSPPPSKEVVDQINEVLRAIAGDLKLQ